ncbi:MAG: lysophospholipid acyltransferase family protein, partial [Bacteroidota bacterium]
MRKPPLTYYLVYPLVKGLLYLWSLLPMPILHLQSSIFAFLIHRVIGYRKAVVLDNLRHAFPEKSEAEIRHIAKGFYLHFCDVIVETVKLMSISAKNLKRRMRHVNPEVLPEMTAHGGGGIAVFAHYANWEWLGAGMGLQLPFSTVGVYKVLSSQVFDRLMLHIRTRLGNDMITMEQTLRESLKRLKSPCYIAFLGDQSPPGHGSHYFTAFLGRPAPVHLGIAAISLKMNVPLYYFDIRRERRGHYAVELVQIPHQDLLPYTKESCYALTERHVEYLE